MNRVLVGLALLGLIGAGVTFGGRSLLRPRRMNILVVSACSVRQDHVGVYQNGRGLTPSIDAWAKDAIVFNNAIAELPWQNFNQYTHTLFTREWLKSVGYHTPFPKKGYIVPPLRRTESGENYWDEKDVLQYNEGLNTLERTLKTDSREEPFYLFVHLKYMHYPYYDDINLNAGDWNTLPKNLKDHLHAYVTTPERFVNKLPLIELLLNSFSLLKSVYHVKGTVVSAAGVISDPQLIQAWRRSAHFEDDIDLARSLYQLKMRKFDAQAARVLNLFGDERLRENTLVIFTGDHGESQMDHGSLGHSVNLYEEMIRYPLIVKGPGLAKSVVDEQVNHEVMVGLVRDLLEGRLAPAEIASAARERSLTFAPSRSCSGNIRSVRWQNRWKFIKNYDRGENELYDLAHDPNERENILTREPEVAWRLEEYLMDHPAAESRRFGPRGAFVCTAN